MKRQLLSLSLSMFLLASLAAVDGASDGGKDWQILTKQNFSSQIRLHPHLLILVTVPWCGESRSLTREVSLLVSEKTKWFESLKLMIIYKNTENMLAESIGSDLDGITIFYYYHGVSFRYRGKVRAKSLLDSIYPYISASNEELLLKRLNSEEELKLFIDSTDKALILMDFCGWATKILAKVKNRGIGDDFTPKGIENGEMKCGIEDGIANSWFGSSLVNNSVCLQESEDAMLHLGLNCSSEEFKQFDSFFSKLISVLREFLLPPERLRFGMVSDRSLLPSLGVEDSDSWMTILHFRGCPGCSKVVRDGDELRSALLTDGTIVRELEVDGQDLQPALPANRPSLILFVDISSDSSEIRRKSREALDAFREVALQYQISDNFSSQNVKQDKSLVQAYETSSATSGHRVLHLSKTAQKIKLKDKTSVMIVNEGNIASELQGKSLQEILEYILQKKKEAKLSTLAKELGFLLVSDDLDIKTVQKLPSQAGSQANDISSPPSEGSPLLGSVDSTNMPHTESKSAVQHEEKPKPTTVESSIYDEDEGVSSDKTNFISMEPDELVEGVELDITGELNAKEKSSSEIDQSGIQELQFQGFKGLFYFCDGNYRLLSSLTDGSTIPSLVLVDPWSEQHYVFPEEATFNYLSLSNFLHGYLNGSLVPYQRIAPILHSPRKAASPPFVNRDFHEMDPIPRVTMHILSKLVSGFNQYGSENATHTRSEDVVVLFSNNWCGFCQRMELVVREVYRAVSSYIKMLKSGFGKVQAGVTPDNSMNNVKFPLFYLMDCTLNDCSLILKLVNKREVYPALVLFPAETETAISYEGDMSVANIIKFISHHGSNSQHLFNQKGIFRATPDGGRSQALLKDSSGAAPHQEGPSAKEKSHEVMLKSENPKKVVKYNGARSRSIILTGLHTATSKVVVGSILTASDKLLNTVPFDKSRIIIAKADEDSGFEGLIFNKPIRWDSLTELEEGLEFLKAAPLFFGGPVIRRGMPFVAITNRVSENQHPEVFPGVYFLDQLATVAKIEELKAGKQSINDYTFFFGYSSWGWHQLFHEINEGAWTVSNEVTSFNLSIS